MSSLKKTRKLVSQIHEEVLDTLEISPELDVKSHVAERIRELGSQFTPDERAEIARDVLSEIFGYGPIDDFVKDDLITEIMVNRFNDVYIEKEGIVTKTDCSFDNNAHLLRIINKIVSDVGRRVDQSYPLVDARLPDGSRINATVPPISVDGPTLTIRKFPDEPLTADDLLKFGTWSPEISYFLEKCVEGRINMIISGGTGSGKTTTLNVLSSFIPNNERIITIEDAAELKLKKSHIIRLESRPPNIEGKGQVTIRDLVKNSLRMRPDRIVVGECRSGEALDMLQAMNTGHDGSLTTVHANGPRDVLLRIETMVLMAGFDLPIRAIREQISSAIQLIVHQSKIIGPDKKIHRKITSIEEIIGMEGDIITTQTIFKLRYERNTEGDLIPIHGGCGIVPRFKKRLDDAGIDLSPLIFKKV